jgi:hypothetical protein
MRVSIHIDDQGVTVSPPDATREEAPSGQPSAVEPPTDLAARAAAVGAISAGPAPVHPPAGTDPGAPGISVGTAELTADVSIASDAIAAGSAPYQADAIEVVEGLEKEAT